MAHDRALLPKELRPINVSRSVAEDPRIAVHVVPSRPLEAGSPNSMPVYFPTTLSDQVSGVAVWSASPPASVGHVALGYGSDLGTRVVSNAHDQSSSGIIAGVGFSQGLNNNGSDRVRTDAVNSNCNIPNIGIKSSGHWGDMGSEEGGDGSSSGKKVKLMCSFQGKIMPRPSDGMLRYVGGQTRVITVKKNVSFDELEQKMSQVYGQPAVIKYQLPDEDLDALVSVSCAEDLDNMMDEYEKLLERSSDGSAKLRVFLFEASEYDSLGMPQYGDVIDCGQRYVEAVNCVVGGFVSKESIASGSSNMNSDLSGIDVTDSIGIGQSDLNAARSSTTFSPHENLVTGHDNAQRLVPPIPRSYPYGDNSYGMPMAVPTVLFSSSQPEPILEKTIGVTKQQQQGGHDLHKPITTPSENHPPTYVDPRLEVLRQPQYFHSPSQLLPTTSPLFSQQPASSVSSHQLFPASHMPMAPFNAQVGAPSVLIQPVIQPHENRLGNYPAESSVGIQKLVPLPSEPRCSPNEAMVSAGIPAGVYGWTQIAPSNHVILPDGGVPHESSSYHTFHADDAERIQQTNNFMGQERFLNYSNHQQIDTLHNNSFATAQGDVTEPFFSEIAKEAPLKVQACRQQENTLDPSVAHDHYRQPSGSVKNLKMYAPTLYTNCQNFISPIAKIGKEEILGSSSQQMPGRNVLQNNTFCQTPLSHNTNHTGPTEALARVVLPGHESRPKESCAPTHSPFLGVPGSYLQSVVGSDQFNSLEAQSINPAYGAVESAYNAANLPLSLSSNPDAVNLPLSLSSSAGADVKDSSNSLFSNQDPWNLQQGLHPPKSSNSEVKNGGFSGQDHFGESQSLLNAMPHSVSHLQDEIHHLEIDTKEDAKADLYTSLKGSEEEHIKQELQNVAEGVAASVLQSTESSYHEPPVKADDHAANLKGKVSRSDEIKQQFTHFKDIRNQLLERLNFGYSGSDSLDQLQIIKDNDLEELRELGSGTFGTVYHGKWRGTDVAIKRINDRCFAGKPSEQERMIDDFWNEAQKLAGLHHPNVVAFYGVVLDSPGGSVATVTEYMVNGSLRNALQKNVRNLDRRKRLLIAMDIAFGMEYLHGKNIVHFDLKSDNLLVNLRDPHRPICKVGDLGLSKVKCQTLISGGVRGTLPWMAPELLNGSSSLVSEKVDVFSFGIVLWELFTGEEPYADLHYGAIIGGIVSNTLRPLIPELCDLDWKLLMEKCWSAEPSERPSFAEIVNELRSMATKVSTRVQVPS